MADDYLHGCAPDIVPCRAFAFTVAAVCRSWRDVALSTPQLWGKITFDFSHIRHDAGVAEDEASRAQRIGVWTSYLETCLARSRSAPLHLRLKSVHSGSDNSSELRPYRTALGLILREIARWRVCKMTTTSLGEGHAYLPLHFQAPSPSLEHFQLRVKSYDQTDEIDGLPSSPVPFLPHAPKLRSLHVAIAMLRHTTFSQMPDIRELILEGCGPVSTTIWPAGFALLEACSSLETLTVKDAYANDGDEGAFSAIPAPSSKLVLRSLTALKLLDNIFPTLQPWPAALSFPALRHLTINNSLNSPACNALLKGIAADSSIEVLRAQCDESSWYDLDVLDILKHFPHLQEAYLSRFAVDVGDVEGLLRKDNASGHWKVCPRLRTLTCTNARLNDDEAAEALLDLARARAAHGPHDARRADAALVLLETFELGDVTDEASVPL